MKFSIHTFVLAAFAAATIAISTSPASAQVFSSNASGDHNLGSGGNISVMVLALPYAGTYMLGGQTTIVNTAGNNQEETVTCWISTANGGASVPYGPSSWATAAASGGVITLPLNGSYTATGPTDLWVVCHNFGAAALATYGNITAMFW
jgi:hypothetical protein